MISSMESPLALTIIDQQGSNLRVAREHPAFEEVKRLLRDPSQPAVVVMDQIKSMLADPLETILRWAARMGFPLNRTPGAGGFDVTRWAPYLSRLMRAGSTPEIAIVMSRMVADPLSIDQSKVCAHWKPASGRGGDAGLRFLYQVSLPVKASIGDSIADMTDVKGDVLGLASTMQPWDGTTSLPGEVVQIGAKVTPLDLVLAEPAVLGQDMTYRVEEASSSGWMQEFSYDSIARAKLGLDEIRETGVEARLVNRITGVVIDV